MRLNHLIYTFIILAIVPGCKKFVDVGIPHTEIDLREAFQTDASASSAVSGIYINMLRDFNFINSGITFFGGMSADELHTLTGDPDELQFEQNEIVPTNPIVNEIWLNAYKNIGLINTCLEGLQLSSGISDATKQQLLGECYFNRAFTNFYLVNIFGDIPIVTGTDFRETSLLSRNDSAVVYDSITSDLQRAKALLSENSDFERIRPNRFAATALLARTYLYQKMYQEAIDEATEVINAGQYTPLPALAAVFLKNSAEAIWQLMPNKDIVYTTQEASKILSGLEWGSPPGISLRTELVQSFESADGRSAEWIDTINASGTDYVFPYKYKERGQFGMEPGEYYIMLRAAEQYLIRAEAYARVNNLSDAVNDIDVIRTRAGLPSVADIIDVSDQHNILQAIIEENRHEFFAEWGHRWFDLKRLGLTNTLLSSLKPSWNEQKRLFPLPQDEINISPNLEQNPGYE